MNSLRRFAFALVLLLVPVCLVAQDSPRGSRYLSVEHWGYDAIAGLRMRGMLPNLDPLVQPYRRDEIAVGIRTLRADTLAEPVANWVRLLQQELAPEIARLEGRDSISIGAQLFGGFTASSSRRLDPLIPYRETPADRTNGWFYYGLGPWLERGRFSGEIRVSHDLYHEGQGNNDPDGVDGGGIIALNRTDNAYLSASYSLGSIMVGRMKRNWAPLGTTALMISDNPTSYPQLGFEIGSPRLITRFLVGELEPLFEQRRYIAAHHLTYRRDDFVISIGEAKVYVANDGGPRIRNLNPFEIFFFDHDTEPKEVASNLMLNGQLWFRLRGAAFFGEAMLDDIDVTPEGDAEPLTYAISMGARVPNLVRGVELGVDYRQVSAFAYRTPISSDRWSFLQRGLGDPWSDYDRLTLSASLFPLVPGLRLTPVLQYQRKGEGDYRDLVPTPDSAHRASKTIFLGVTETTVRAGLQGRYQPVTWAFVEWDAGFGRISNTGHVDGKSSTEFSGVGRVGMIFTTEDVTRRFSRGRE